MLGAGINALTCIVKIACFPQECVKRITSCLIDLYRSKLYEYNRIVRRWGLILKPVHIVISKGKTYFYYGKYWYRLEKRGTRLKWIYVGKTKPLKEIPDPPINPLSIVSISSSEGLMCLCIKSDVKDPHVVRTAVRELLQYLRAVADRYSVQCIGS